ncbi:MAG: NUDIX domain-containing protein [Clostridia bacterium]|nr:NUDIX domain-containing protein [Clostridia bacterium]
MEIWDGYRADGTPLGIDLVRGEPVPEGVYFLVVEILVRHTDGEYLLMRRDLGKPAFPGYFEATAGGAAQKGEDPLTAALRELREETGIEAEALEPIANMLYRQMICYQYLCVTDRDKDSITLQEGETIGYKWVSESEFIEFISSGDMIPTQKERYTEYFKKLGYIK